jgi:hypothetical protein
MCCVPITQAGMEAGFLSDPRLALVHWQAGDRSLPAPRARIVGHGADFVRQETTTISHYVRTRRYRS